MSKEPDILTLLSAYRDGELSPREREKVEKALAADPALQARLVDMEAVSLRLHEALQMRAAGADLAGFSDRVMQRLGKRRAPLLERLRVALSEMLEFRPLQLAAGAVAAVLIVAVSVVALRSGPVDTGAPQIAEAPAEPPRLVAPGERVAMTRESLVKVLSVNAPEGRDTMLLSSNGTTLIYVQ